MFESPSDVAFLLAVPASIRLRYNLLMSDLDRLEKTADNVHKHVALRARISELASLLSLLHPGLTVERLAEYASRANLYMPTAPAEASEPSSPAPVYEVPGWRLGAPAAGFKSFRCADPECEGNDHTVQLFHGICYRCLHKPSYSHKYQEKDGYQVKVWPPQRPGEWAVLRDSSWVAIAGKVAEGGHWFGAGLPVMHMDFDKAVEFAVFEAEKAKKGGAHV